jgi:hypothetical protein
LVKQAPDGPDFAAAQLTPTRREKKIEAIPRPAGDIVGEFSKEYLASP